MPREVSNVLSQILAIVFFVAMGGTPLIILGLGILNFARNPARRTKIVLQGLSALAIWTLLSLVIVSIFFMTVFEYPAYRSQTDEIKSTVIFTGGSLIYILVAGVLIYWTQRQRKRLPPMGISC